MLTLPASRSSAAGTQSADLTVMVHFPGVQFQFDLFGERKDCISHQPDWKECPARRIYPSRKALCCYLQSAQFSAKFKIIRAEFHVNQLQVKSTNMN